MVQEALQNVRKHAEAEHVTIASRIDDDLWVVEVRDDGGGFDIGSVATRGRRNFGLQFMRERAELIGAALEVPSRPDGGTVVRLAVPLGKGELMSAIDYSGPERRRGGPDRRNTASRPRSSSSTTTPCSGRACATSSSASPTSSSSARPTTAAAPSIAPSRPRPTSSSWTCRCPAPGGIETTQRIKRELPSAGIIVLAQNEDEDALFDAIKAGAAAFILKDVGPDDLVTIIRRVVDGEYLINDKVFAKPAVASRVLKEFRELAVYGQEAAPIFAPLSPREVEILDNIAQGMTNKQVAYALSISEQTVKNHMSSILRKLSVNDRTQAVVYAMRQGWIRMPED